MVVCGQSGIILSGCEFDRECQEPRTTHVVILKALFVPQHEPEVHAQLDIEAEKDLH